MASLEGRLLGTASPFVAIRSHVPSNIDGNRLFLLIIVGLMAALLVWASLAPIDRVVRVEGTVIPAGRNQQIQHLEGGIIASIDTTEGAVVKRGDLLMTIDGTIVAADMADVQGKQAAARVRVARLEAETQGLAKPIFPPDLQTSPLTTAEESLFVARRQKLNEEIVVHQNAIQQRENDIAQAQRQLQSLTAELVTAEQRLAMEQDMAAQGAASRMEVLEAQSRDQRLKTEISGIETSIPKYRAAIAEEQARMQTAKADFNSQAHNDLVAALEDVARFTQVIKTVSDRQKRTEIRAPIEGVVNHINVNTVGGVVKPGETLVELTPNSSSVLIEAKAVPRDRGYLRVGLKSQVRVSAFDSSELGPLIGEVIQVGSDSISDARNIPYYQINILVGSLPPSYVGRSIVPGMTVTADIVIGQRTVLAYLLSPVSKFTYNMFRDPR